MLARLLSGPSVPASDLLEDIVSKVGVLLWFFVRLPGLKQELLEQSELAVGVMEAGAALLESCSMAWEFRRSPGNSSFLPGLLETLNKLLMHLETMSEGRGQAYARLRTTVLSPERIISCGARLLRRLMETQPGRPSSIAVGCGFCGSALKRCPRAGSKHCVRDPHPPPLQASTRTTIWR